MSQMKATCESTKDTRLLIDTCKPLAGALVIAMHNAVESDKYRSWYHQSCDQVEGLKLQNEKGEQDLARVFEDHVNKAKQVRKEAQNSNNKLLEENTTLTAERDKLKQYYGQEQEQHAQLKSTVENLQNSVEASTDLDEKKTIALSRATEDLSKCRNELEDEKNLSDETYGRWKQAREDIQELMELHNENRELAKKLKDKVKELQTVQTTSTQLTKENDELQKEITDLQTRLSEEKGKLATEQDGRQADISTMDRALMGIKNREPKRWKKLSIDPDVGRLLQRIGSNRNQSPAGDETSPSNLNDRRAAASPNPHSPLPADTADSQSLAESQQADQLESTVDGSEFEPAQIDSPASVTDDGSNKPARKRGRPLKRKNSALEADRDSIDVTKRKSVRTLDKTRQGRSLINV